MTASAFEAERPRLTAIAGRILASSAEADDVVQEAWLRLARTDDVDDLPAWLTTVVTRLCLDHLRERRTRARAEAGASFELAPGDPESDTVLAERVSGAMQVVLDTLAPAERAAFVLHDVFGYPFEQVSQVLGRSGTAVRQLASRARRKVQNTPEPEADRAARIDSRRVVDAFITAARGGELGTLLTLLAPDVVMQPDLAAQQMGTETRYDGPDAVAARFNGARGAAPVALDGDPGAAWIMDRSVKVAFAFHVEGGLVREIELIADPEVLASIEVTRHPSPRRRKPPGPAAERSTS